MATGLAVQATALRAMVALLAGWVPSASLRAGCPGTARERQGQEVRLWVWLGVGGGGRDQRGEFAGVSGFVEDGVDVFEDFVDGHGIHFASVIVAGFDGLFEIAASALGSERVGDDVAGAFFLFDPGEARHGDPDGAAVHVEADVDGVGVAGGDGDDVSCPAAVEGIAGPAVGYEKVFVHGYFQRNGACTARQERLARKVATSG